LWTVTGPGECAFLEPTDYLTTITCDSPGSYTLTMTANYGPTVTDTADLTVFAAMPANSPPTNDAGGPYSGAEDEPIALTATASDVDNDGLSHSWSVEGPGTCDFSDPTSLTPTITCDQGGDYSLTLTTSDGEQSTSDTATLNIEREPKPVPTTPAPAPTETTPTQPTAEAPATTTSTASLPVTGSSLTSVMASGVLLVALGGTALLFGRLRRARAEG
jgi:hypothetical protein